MALAERAIGVRPAASLSEFADLVEQSTKRVRLWYRGCGRTSYTLVPGLFRDKKKGRSAPDLVKLEHQLVTMFRQRGMAFHPAMPDDDWQTMFLMQHSRGPTRLLDWTENPFVALYFALTSAERSATPEDACVWAMDPVSWNQGALATSGYAGGILSVGDDELEPYRPMKDPGLMASEPVNAYSIHNSSRVVAQRGVFTVFGLNATPMESTHAALEFPGQTLAKFEVPRTSIDAMLVSLRRAGYTESAIFPDLDGLATELRRDSEL